MRLKDFPEEELFLKGSAACAGCPGSMALRVAFKALGRNTLLVVIASCTSVLQSPFPYSALGVPVLNMAFATGGATGSGVAAAVEHLLKKGILRERPNVLVWAGDGGTYDIGIQALSGAAERGEDFIYVCYNNEAYSNTGTQRSGATPYAAWTSNTISGKREWRKDVAQIMVAHDLPYVATASLAYPTDFFNKMRKAASIRGTKYIEMLAPCPPGWKFPSDSTVRVSRLAVQTGVWLLYEHENGRTAYTAGTKRIIEGQSELLPVSEYLKAQGRFRHLFRGGEEDERVRDYQKRIDEVFDNLRFASRLRERLMDLEIRG